jgi:hypothetical protein
LKESVVCFTGARSNHKIIVAALYKVWQLW